MLFEFVYFARPDSRLYGQSMHQARIRMGEQLAGQAPVDADMVMGVPESGVPAAEGFARRSGIPLGQGLVKNRYIGRSFIAPSQEMRAEAVRMKLNPHEEHRRQAAGGGRRLHRRRNHPEAAGADAARGRRPRGAPRITSPPVAWSCFYGIDTGWDELIAAHLDVDGIREYLNLDTLTYLTSIGWSRPPGPPAPASATPASPATTRYRSRSRCASTSSSRTGAIWTGTCSLRSTARSLDGRMGETYRGAGVDIAAGEVAVAHQGQGRSTYRSEVLGDIGGFGGLVEVPAGYRQPVLVSSTDGVGTKAMVARAAGRLDTIGIDLVAMCVDDITCLGAEPLFFLDYISVGALDPDQIDALVSGVVEGCRRGLRPGRRRDGGAPGCPRARRVRPGGIRGGRGRATGSSRATARAGDVSGSVAGPALQRLFAGPQGAVRARRAGARGRAVPRGTPSSTSCRPSVIYAPATGALRRRRRARRGPHHRGRAGRQRALRAARGRRRRAGSFGVGGAGVHRDPAPVRWPTRRWPGVQPRLGMVVVVPPGDAGRTLALLRGAGHAAVEVGRLVPAAEGAGREVHLG